MRTLLIVVYYALALVGCSPPRTVTDLRADIDGRVFHGRVEARDGVDRFECIDSAIGMCRFFVHAADCGPRPPGAASCTPPTIAQVDVGSGETRQVFGLPRRARVCLATDAGGHC
jgi:hypothetical protein